MCQFVSLFLSEITDEMW